MTGRRAILGVSLTAITLTACGGGNHFANQARPAVPVNVSVYINDHRVSVSPGTISPGAVTLTINNQASSSASVNVMSSGGSGVTSTGPISPQANEQVTLNLGAGQYSVEIAPASSTQAAAGTPTGIMPGQLTVQGKRQVSNNQLLQP